MIPTTWLMPNTLQSPVFLKFLCILTSSGVMFACVKNRALKWMLNLCTSERYSEALCMFLWCSACYLILCLRCICVVLWVLFLKACRGTMTAWGRSTFPFVFCFTFSYYLHIYTLEFLSAFFSFLLCVCVFLQSSEYSGFKGSSSRTSSRANSACSSPVVSTFDDKFNWSFSIVLFYELFAHKDGWIFNYRQLQE